MRVDFAFTVVTACALVACGGDEESLAERLAGEVRAAEQDARALAAIDLSCRTTADCGVLSFVSVERACGFASYASVSLLSQHYNAAQDAATRNQNARTEYSRVTNQQPVSCAPPPPDEGRPLCENQQCRVAPLSR
jgi:hypothetical protein